MTKGKVTLTRERSLIFRNRNSEERVFLNKRSNGGNILRQQTIGRQEDSWQAAGRQQAGTRQAPGRQAGRQGGVRGSSEAEAAGNNHHPSSVFLLTRHMKAVSSCPPVATRSGCAGLHATASTESAACMGTSSSSGSAAWQWARERGPQRTRVPLEGVDGVVVDHGVGRPPSGCVAVVVAIVIAVVVRYNAPYATVHER